MAPLSRSQQDLEKVARLAVDAAVAAGAATTPCGIRGYIFTNYPGSTAPTGVDPAGVWLHDTETGYLEPPA